MADRPTPQHPRNADITHPARESRLTIGTQHAPTMAEVAARAGVSHQTVSRVVNNAPGVRASTREKVQQAIAELDYRRNLAARALVTKRSGLIGVIAVGSFLYGPTSTLASLERAAREHSYLTLIATISETNQDQFRAALDEFLERSVEAVIVIASREPLVRLVDTLNLDIPLIVVGPPPRDTQGLRALSVDQAAGARLAVAHLASLGHRDIALIAGPENWIDAQRRLEGARGQCADDGLRYTVFPGDWSPASGRKAGEEIAALPPGERPTAIFSANDHMALGAIAALTDSGVAVPREISIIGFDDLPGTGFYLPALTTVHQDFSALGSRVLETILCLLSGTTPPDPRIAPRLVLRDSVAPPPSAARDATS